MLVGQLAPRVVWQTVPEFQLCPLQPQDTSSVELGHGQGHLFIHILIEDAHENYGQRGECEIVQENIGILEKI